MSTDDQPRGLVTASPTLVPPIRTQPAVSPVRVLLDAQRHLGDEDVAGSVAHRIVEAACAMTGARYAALFLLADEGEIVDHAHCGMSGRELAALGHLVGPISGGRGSGSERVAQFAAAGLRCFPLMLRRRRVAELYLPRAAPLLSRGTVESVELIEAFAALAATAVENARLRTDARELHDNVMQRLFATGVGLQSLAGRALPSDVSSRLAHHIDDLDDTIDEIRDRVEGLRGTHTRCLTTSRASYVANTGGV